MLPTGHCVVLQWISNSDQVTIGILACSSCCIETTRSLEAVATDDTWTNSAWNGIAAYYVVCFRYIFMHAVLFNIDDCNEAPNQQSKCFVKKVHPS